MKQFIHMFCGPIHLNSTEAWKWTNVDHELSHRPDVVLDALKMSEHFGENFADAIWACHGLEHLSHTQEKQDTLTFLKVAKHTLKPGGIIRIAVPDLFKAAISYTSGSDMTFLYGKEHKGFFFYDRPAERFTYFMRAWDHTVVFDFPLLKEMLQDAGFVKIRECSPNDSEIDGFSHDRFISESLYVEARKP